MPNYTAHTNSNNGITYIEESGGGGGGSGCYLLLVVIVLVVGCIAQLIWAKTGVNVFDYFEGITGPCGTCTPTP